jgi:hypothetical protein
LGVADERQIGDRFRALAPELSERARRIWAASEARAIGRGGIAAVARASGISPNTIRRGIREIEADEVSMAIGFSPFAAIFSPHWWPCFLPAGGHESPHHQIDWFAVC